LVGGREIQKKKAIGPLRRNKETARSGSGAMSTMGKRGPVPFPGENFLQKKAELRPKVSGGRGKRPRNPEIMSFVGAGGREGARRGMEKSSGGDKGGGGGGEKKKKRGNWLSPCRRERGNGE